MTSEHSRVTQLSTSAKQLGHSVKPPDKPSLQLCDMVCVGFGTYTKVAAQQLQYSCGDSLPHTCRLLELRII